MTGDFVRGQIRELLQEEAPAIRAADRATVERAPDHRLPPEEGHAGGVLFGAGRGSGAGPCPSGIILDVYGRKTPRDL